MRITPIWPRLSRAVASLSRKMSSFGVVGSSRGRWLLLRVRSRYRLTRADAGLYQIPIGGHRSGGRRSVPSPQYERGEPPECISLPEPVVIKRSCSPVRSGADRMSSYAARSGSRAAPREVALRPGSFSEVGRTAAPSNQSMGVRNVSQRVSQRHRCDALGALVRSGSVRPSVMRRARRPVR